MRFLIQIWLSSTYVQGVYMSKCACDTKISVWQTREGSDVVFCCSSPASVFNVFCILRWFSAQRSSNMWFCGLSYSSSQLRQVWTVSSGISDIRAQLLSLVLFWVFFSFSSPSLQILETFVRENPRSNPSTMSWSMLLRLHFSPILMFDFFLYGCMLCTGWFE